MLINALQPWLAPFGPMVSRGADALSSGAPVASVLNALGVAPVRFSPQSVLPPDEPYERFIFRTGTVPTRDNLHDFFNGLLWLHCPQAKRRLNELQAAEIDRVGVGATRGSLRDALTLFDENGAVLDAPVVLWKALVARDWNALFIDNRALWGEARLLVFGHALLEKLQLPRKAMTAHVLRASGADPSIRNDDASIAAALDPAHLASKPFVPLPVLGVPGWWPGNTRAEFYDDPDVFRRS